MKQLIECVPNISEGRDMNIINQVTAEIEKVEGVKLLDVDPGATTNRTVITFVGEPEPVCEAAYRVVKRASELIDMRNHHGAHPRQGATDVCPLVPVANITMDEVVEYAHKLAERIGGELQGTVCPHIIVYLHVGGVPHVVFALHFFRFHCKDMLLMSPHIRLSVSENGLFLKRPVLRYIL